MAVDTAPVRTPAVRTTDPQRRKASTGRAGPLVHALPVVVLLAPVFPLYFSFVVAGNDNSLLGDAVPPLTPGGDLVETVQVALSALASGYCADCSLMLAGASPAVLPVVAIFILPSRRIVGGITQGALKG